MTAIAVRDLRQEFSGRRVGLLGIIALLMLPAIAVEVPERKGPFTVSGQVPERVLALEGVKGVRKGGMGFAQRGETLRVYGFFMQREVRDALDEGKPAIEVEVVRPPLRWPKRSLFFALIAASTLTGSVSTSIGGERTRKTLQALLSAAVSKLEIVLGKWLAWAGFGTMVSMTAAAGALLWGKQEAGPWLVALPLVPALTVALGLWLVRRTDDVIAGTSVSLRVLPAVLGAGAVLSLLLSTRSDVAAALLPLGGVMLAAGDIWQGSWGLTALACASSAVTTAVLLWMTARDLEEQGDALRQEVAWLETVRDGTVTAVTWWTLLAGPVLWGWAGNAAATAHLQVGRGLAAGTALLFALSAVAWARKHMPSFGWSWKFLPAAAVVALSSFIPGLTFENPWANECAERLAAGLFPPLLFLPLLFVQEVWFRGFLQRGGWVLAAIAWTLAVSPTNPVAGLLSGLALGWAARDGLGNALAARLIGVAAVYGWSTTIP